eukprot:6487394-Prymnesium_polylepis.1
MRGPAVEHLATGTEAVNRRMDRRLADSYYSPGPGEHITWARLINHNMRSSAKLHYHGSLARLSGTANSRWRVGNSMFAAPCVMTNLLVKSTPRRRRLTTCLWGSRRRSSHSGPLRSQRVVATTAADCGLSVWC